MKIRYYTTAPVKNWVNWEDDFDAWSYYTCGLGAAYRNTDEMITALRALLEK